MGFMKILATVIVLSLCLFAGSAQAADSTYNWSGIYGGASIGYVHGDQAWELQPGSGWWGPSGGKEQFTFNNFEVGAHLGAQYQWKWLVLGAEGGIFKGPKDEQEKISPYFPSTDRWKADIHTIAKATARAGYAYKRLLAFVKGGYAGAFVDTDLRPPKVQTSDWHNGWTIGAGVEYALTNHVIIGFEYNYIDLGTKNHMTLPPGGSGPGFFSADVDAAVHQVLFRLSYKFDVF
jgi:outer membrane immunogenic protein